MIISVQEIRAADIGIGASTWYTEWDFKVDKGNKPDKINPALMYGPVLSVKFSQRWSLSSLFLYGKFKAEDDSIGTLEKFDFKRMDSDTLLNYSINAYLKIFAGYKFVSYKWEPQQMSGKHTSMGGGGGIGLILPLSGNFYLLGNASGIYAKGTHEEKLTTMNLSRKRDVTSPGYNLNASLAYYMAPASVTLSLGYRYQYFKTKFGRNSIPQWEAADEYKSKFYGVTFQAVYSFDL
jgi:hypothetical protein